MKDGAAYLRAGDIVALTGMSIRTVRRWIADETLPSTKPAALGSSRKSTLNTCYPPAADLIEELDEA